MSSSLLILLSAFFGACETALIRSIGTTHDFLELMTAQYLGVSILCTFWMIRTRTPFLAPCWRLHLARGCTGLCASVSAIILAQASTSSVFLLPTQRQLKNSNDCLK